MRIDTTYWSRPVYLLFLTASIIVFLLFAHSIRAADSIQHSNITHTKVTAEILKAKIKEVDATADLKAETKAKLIELYRKALSYLEAKRSNKSSQQVYVQARKKALQHAKAIRKKLDKAKSDAPKVVLKVSKKTPTFEIEQLLLSEKANFAAVEAKLSGLEEKLAIEANRPDVARQRITDAKSRLQALASEQKIPEAKDQLPIMREAKHWVLSSESMALSAELKTLDTELLSQPMRIELLQAQRDETVRSLERIDTRVRLLEETVNQRRRAEAEEALAQTKAAQVEAKGKHPIIQKIAQDNAVLSEELSSLANIRQGVTDAVDVANKESRQIDADFQNAKQKLEIAGMGQVLGQVLQEQRRNLPDLRLYRKKAQEREKLSIESGLRLLHHKEERRYLRDMDAYIKRLTKDIPQQEIEQVSGELLNLLKSRKKILGKIITADNAYLRELAELDVAHRKALNSAVAYDEFLAERLLWLRSTPPVDLAALQALPSEIARLLSPSGWIDVVTTLAYQLIQSFTFVLLLILFALLLWYKKLFKQALIGTAACLGKISTDRLVYTFQALGYTVLLAIPWPLFMLTIGWQLRISLDATEFPRAIGVALVYASFPFYSLRVFRLLCFPKGIAAEHFRWSGASLKLLRHELNRLLAVFLPAYIVAMAASNVESGTVVKLAFVVAIGSLALFLYQVLHPTKGALQAIFRQRADPKINRLQYFWFPMVVAVPLVLVGLALAGYVYTAGTLTGLLFVTLWLLLVLLVLEQLTKRWLLLTRRRLALQAAIERRAAARAAAQAKESDMLREDSLSAEIEEPAVDLIALSEESRKLVNTALVIIGIVGLWVIWSRVLPAFGILSEISLWHHTVVVNGAEQLEPITLADLGLAFIFGFLTMVLTKNLPALQEIILLKRLDMTSGTRYAVTTLTGYAIATIGIILVWNTIGGEWSQIQWLAAALSLGIGFGLQEIVANFISGIIILFERPIRVGDVVTVGDTDGVVTRIQIRATTIRNWDRKELLVPNKEFITGRLLNWTLSDQITRVIVTVGVAYGSDVDKAMELMIEAAHEQEHALEDPEPRVTFEEFGDSALILRLRVYIPSIDYRITTLSGVHQAINRKFNEAGVVIAFPQVDVHYDAPSDVNKSIESKRGAAHPELD